MQKVKPQIITVSTGIALNLILFFIKLYVGISTNSITIYLDSINNLMDTLVCIIAVIGFYALSAKPNEKYPFGYGRSEDLVSFITSVIVFLTSASFLYASLQRVLYPTPVRFSAKFTGLIAATAVMKILLGIFFKHRYKKTPSPVIKSLQIDSFLDFFITLTTILSFTLTEYMGYAVDGFFGLAIGIMLLISSVKLCISSCGKLLGKKDYRLYSEAVDFLCGYDFVNEVKVLQIHSYGQKNIFCCEIIANDNNFSKIDILKADFADKFNSDIIISIIGGNKFGKD